MAFQKKNTAEDVEELKKKIKLLEQQNQDKEDLEVPTPEYEENEEEFSEESSEDPEVKEKASEISRNQKQEILEQQMELLQNSGRYRIEQLTQMQLQNNSLEEIAKELKGINSLLNQLLIRFPKNIKV